LPVAFARHYSTPLAENQGVVMNLARVEFEPVEFNASICSALNNSRGRHLPVCRMAFAHCPCWAFHPAKCPSTTPANPGFRDSVRPARTAILHDKAREQANLNHARTPRRTGRTRIVPPHGEPR
jgi:hypothetical protein